MLACLFSLAFYAATGLPMRRQQARFLQRCGDVP